MPSTNTQNSLNALETRDITLPRRLWSWLVTQAKKSGRSVDEVIADLIDTHRHPEVVPLEPEDQPPSDREAAGQDKADTGQEEAPQDGASASSGVRDSTDSSRPQGAPPPSANASQSADDKDAEEDGPDTYSAADRLRKASDRLQHLMDDENGADEQVRSSESTGTQIQDLLKNNDKLQTLEPPESASQKDPDEGVSMFDMAAGADGDDDAGSTP